MKVGEIYLNRWASEDNPSRVFIITAINAKYVYGKYRDNKGNLRVVRFYKQYMKTDLVHYERLGYFNYQKVIADYLKDMKERADNEQREAENTLD